MYLILCGSQPKYLYSQDTQGDLGGFADHRRQTIFFCGQSMACRQVQGQVQVPVRVPAGRYRCRYKYLCVYLPAGTDAGKSTCACTCRLVQVPVQIPVLVPASRCRYQYLYLPLVQVQVQFPAQATPRTAGPSTQPRPTGSLRGRWRAAMPWSVALKGRKVILKKKAASFWTFS